MCKGQQMQYRADNKIQNMMLIYNVNTLVILTGSRVQENTNPQNTLNLYIWYMSISIY